MIRHSPPGPHLHLIAIVDDEQSVRRALGRLLSAHGLMTEPFLDGRAFLARVEADASFQPDCVLLDIFMPGVDGFEVQTRLHELRRPFPIVFITAHDEASLREQALAGGASTLLQKPVREAVLLEALRNTCAAWHQDEGRAPSPRSEGESP